MQNPKLSLTEIEFVILAAMLMALVALSIDMMLPALPAISNDLGNTSDNSRQHVISVIFVGLTFAQIVYGPLSDSIGRKPTIAIGIVIFIIGSLISAFADTFQTMLTGRLLQGIGVASTRVVLIAVVRDRYEGEQMARIMSLIFGIFVIVPCLAPLLGQGVLIIADWRAIFHIFVVLSVLLLSWFWLRQAETLQVENRRPVNIRSLLQGAREAVTNRVAILNTLAMGLLNGAFIGYLLSSQQVFQETYSVGQKFPLYFAILAVAVGVASFINAKIVVRVGMVKLSVMAAIGMTLVCLALIVNGEILRLQLSVYAFTAAMAVVFFLIGIALGNLNAIALEPLGHIAGTATSVLSVISGAISIFVGWAIGATYDGTIMPLIYGIFFCSLISVFLMLPKTSSIGVKPL